MRMVDDHSIALRKKGYASHFYRVETDVTGAAQWRLANHRLCLFLERCCMGVVNQIKDLDNSSKPLPYKSTGTFIVGEGLAPPGTFPINVCYRQSKAILS